MSQIPEIRWLHLTDLHMGMKDSDWLWPNAEHKLLYDIENQFKTAGPWDLVLFTGDLVQQGKEKEYKKFESDFLDVLWERFNKLGCDPKLLVVPGNHDLQWQDPDSAAVGMLEMWHQKPAVAEKFWGDKDNEYIQAVQTAFSDFDKWWKNTKYRPKELIPGFLPGDFLYPFEKDGLQLGIVGLNSAFLQLTGAKDYEERLELHHNQCRTDGVRKYTDWLNSNHVNILMTHHPTDWLHPETKKRLNGELKQFFALHLCGHNHQTALHQQLTGAGKYSPLQWTGRSLFGLEKYDDGKEDREHGYAAGAMRVKSESEGYTQFRPRWRFEHNDGAWNMDRDPHGAEPDSQWSIEFPVKLRKLWSIVKPRKGKKPPKGPFRDWVIKKIAQLLSSNERFRQFVADALDESGEPYDLAQKLVSTGLSDFWQAADYENKDAEGEFLEPIEKLVFFLAQAACNPEMIDTLKEQLTDGRRISVLALRTRYAEMGALVLSAASGNGVVLRRGDGEMQLEADHFVSMSGAYLNELGFDSTRAQSDALEILMKKFKLDVKLGANYETRRKDLEQILLGRADRLKHVAVAHYGTGPLNIPHIVDFVIPYPSETTSEDNVTLVGDAGLYDLICDILGELDSRKKLKNRGTI